MHKTNKNIYVAIAVAIFTSLIIVLYLYLFNYLILVLYTSLLASLCLIIYFIFKLKAYTSIALTDRRKNHLVEKLGYSIFFFLASISALGTHIWLNKLSPLDTHLIMIAAFTVVSALALLLIAKSLRKRLLRKNQEKP